MYEVTVTFTRPDLSHDFFIFQTKDKDLLAEHAKYRNEQINTPGFISMSYVMSPDKLQLKVITLWESKESITVNSYKKKYGALFKKYQTRNSVVYQIETEFLPDTEKLKAKKLSSRLTVAEANKNLIEYIT
jgi:hypothetical protein